GDDDSDNLLIVEVDEETSMLRMLANENKSLEREIVALLNDLSGDCDSCEHNDECEDYPRNCVEGDRWEWRGIVEVEKGAKHDK
ncbi:MAG: hypothetical protein J6V15_02085, partial [Clostridia bacterium]|nr:hypothetical protein [Clostridia bacterium]